ncbi:TPA: hypothetical protein IAA68_00455 [Candidatus Galligastranaerophilus faecipullorum]|nr:hypothetical protein [Candidatus Galligastranaerophilus faecipullorum]
MKRISGSLILTALLLMLLNPYPAFAANVITLASHLSKIEQDLWGFEYGSQTDSERISRIEESVFGKINENETIEKRIEKINRALGLESQKEAQSSAGELMSEEVDGVSYPQIDALETKLFSKVYDKENIYKRIERLEKKIFGSTQDGDLASRTDKLKGYLNIDTTPKTVYSNENYQAPYGEYNPSFDTYGSDINIQISGLENSLFGKTFSQDPTGLRLNRLERKIFQRDFSSDDDILRMQRLQAAASAKKTAKYYDMNKAQKFTSTGLQIGTLILMILAMIL